MGRKKTSQKVSKLPPAESLEERENQMIALAIDLAEEQLRNKTASTQVIVHYLKLGSTRGQLENEMLERKTELAGAQVEAIKSEQKREELYEEALRAMSVYNATFRQD